MRSLRVVGLGEDGKIVICEDPARGERFQIPADERLRAAARGDITRLGQIAIELESQMRPREIQSRIRAGESVEQVAAAAGVPASRVERFAYPVLLERSRTAELAQRAHPIREDGPDVQELGEVVAQAFTARGQDYTAAMWDSWKGEDGKWVIQLTWTAGRSHNRAHWSFHPGAHGGTVTPLDDHAIDLLDPNPNRQLRTVRPVTELAAQALQVERPPLEPVERRQAVGAGEPPRRGPEDPEPRTEQEFVQDIELTDEQELPMGLTDPEPRKPSPTPRQPPPRDDTRTPATEPARTTTAAPPRQAPAAPSRQAAEASNTAEAPPRHPADAPARESATTSPHTTDAPTRQSATASPTTDAPSLRPAGQEPPAPSTTDPAPRPDESQEPPRQPAEPAAAAPPRQPAASSPAPDPDPQPEPTPEPEPEAPPAAATEPKPAAAKPRKGKKGRPIVPSWEDVLLGTRSNR